MEDQVFHALSAEGLRALLAERPAHRFGDVALAAAVGAHDSGNARQDFDDDLFAKRLEALKRDGLETHEVI